MTTLMERYIEITEDINYKISRLSVYQDWEDGLEIGQILLLNLKTGLLERFSIYCGDEEGNLFYICLPTGEKAEEEEEELKDCDLESFDIHLIPFKGLSKRARYNAVNEYCMDCSILQSKTISFRAAYRHLRNSNQTYLYDLDGVLLTNGGMY